jgi:tRNA-2-methylthio-N6-dimethylallyladenosine synthase
MSEVIITPTITASRKLYIESYGCAMNFSDSEIIASIMG